MFIMRCERIIFTLILLLTVFLTAQAEEILSIPTSINIDFQHFDEPKLTNAGMSVLITEITGFDIAGGTEIACVTPEGVVAGAWIINADSIGQQIGLAVWKDDDSTEVIEGFHREGDPLHFLLWDPVHDWELDLAFDIIEGEFQMDEAVYQTNGFIVLGTTVGVHQSGPTQPDGFQLSNPFPNPFNDKTVVGFNITVKSDVDIRIFDISGRMIRNLSNRAFPPGQHEYSIDASGLTSGLYLIVLESTGHREAVRAVLLR
jgi:hypothetical protein